VLASYAQTTNIDEPLSEFRSGTANYYEQDGIGSVSSLTNSAAAVSKTYAYDSFGNIAASSGSITNPLQYTGREFDPEIGLYQYRMRYYDQSIGRFISEDPYRSLFGMNRYKYVSNHPIMFNDPLGLSDTCTEEREYRLTPWIPTSTNSVPDTGWTFASAGETGGPDAESGVPAAQLYCIWTRTVTKTRNSVAVVSVEWKCTYQMPCGLQGTYYKTTWEVRHNVSTSTSLESTTSRVLIMGTDSDFYDEFFCRRYLRP
jgi:RHS repeat-associated protein